MPSHPIDFQIQSYVFSTETGLSIFDEKTRFQRWLNFEAALAESQSELGIIPKDAALAIKKEARLERLNIQAIARDYTTNRNSLVPIVKELRAACGSHGEYVHFGATTQDVLDTSLVQELSEVLEEVFNLLARIELILLDLCTKHRLTPMIGRTHSQQAIPITFGLKTSIWMLEVRRHIDRIISLAPRLLVGQLSGAVGTMAALGPRGKEVARGTMQRLGLGTSIAPWHTSRDNIAEACLTFSLICASAAKIANEIFQLGKNEIGELREPAATGKTAGSSTMPHKRNPVLCQRIAVLAHHVRALAPTTIEGMVHENERDPRALWTEWLAVPQICIYTLTSIEYLHTVLANLEVHPQNMLRNLHLHKDTIISEWLLFRISGIIGKIEAEKIVKEVLAEISQGNTLETALRQKSSIAGQLTAEDFAMLASPERYIGLAPEIINDAVTFVSARKKQDPQSIRGLLADLY